MGLLSKLGKNKQSVPDDSAPDAAAVSTPTVSSTGEAVSSGSGRNRRKSPSSDRKPRVDAVDPMLPEKKRARRRLIGSIALALALVIVLPMVLDTEPKPLPADIAIQIPARDAPENRQPLRQAPTASPLVMPEDAEPAEEIIELPATPKRVPLHAATKPAVDAPVKRREEQAATGEPKPTIDRVSLKAAVETEPAAREKRSLTEPAPPKERAAEDSKREAAKTALDKKAEKSEKADKVVLQVAALASMDKATELQSRLADAGVRSYTQKVSTGSGERIRVRIGPYSNQEEADKVRAKLAGLGLNGTVVPN